MQIFAKQLALLILLLLGTYEISAQRYNGKSRNFLKQRKGRHVFKTDKGNYPRTKADFESKFTLGIFTGAVQTLSSEKINKAGVSENIFGGYKTSPVIGGAIFFNRTSKISTGGRIKYFYLQKPLYFVNNFTFQGDFKYHLIKSDKKFSPYIFAGPSFTLISVKQKTNEYIYNPVPEYSVEGERDILVTEIHYFNPSVSLSFVPVPGLGIGAGFNAKIWTTVSWFVQAETNFGFAKNNNSIKGSFIDNKSNMNNFILTTGLNIKFLKSKYLY